MVVIPEGDLRCPCCCYCCPCCCYCCPCCRRCFCSCSFLRHYPNSYHPERSCSQHFVSNAAEGSLYFAFASPPITYELEALQKVAASFMVQFYCKDFFTTRNHKTRVIPARAPRQQGANSPGFTTRKPRCHHKFTTSCTHTENARQPAEAASRAYQNLRRKRWREPETGSLPTTT